MFDLLVMFRIVEDERPPLPEECSENLQSFLKWCFNKDPTKRPNAEQLCEHEWLKKHSAAHKVSWVPPVRRVEKRSCSLPDSRNCGPKTVSRSCAASAPTCRNRKLSVTSRIWRCLTPTGRPQISARAPSTCPAPRHVEGYRTTQNQSHPGNTPSSKRPSGNVRNVVVVPFIR